MAEVKDTYEERRSAYRYNGESALAVNVIQKPDSSSPQVIARVRKELEKIESQYPGLEFEEAYDNSFLVELIKDSTTGELLISVALAGYVGVKFTNRCHLPYCLKILQIWSASPSLQTPC